MKKFLGCFVLIALFLFSITPTVFCQNLVPNPSFEDTVSCPLGGDQLYKAEHWHAFRASPDYFHSCCISTNCVVGVPNNDFGYQYPHSGNAYAGMITYDLTGAPYREYLAAHLTNPTSPGIKYYFTCYINWSGKPGFTIANNKFGIALSNILYDSANPYPISNNPIVYSDSIYADSLGWSKVELSFIASGNDEYLVLGNLFDDLQTDTINLGQFNVHSYYFIDDVCLSVDSNFCALFTGINSPLQNQLSILESSYFISDNQLSLKFLDKTAIKNIEIYNVQGQLVKKLNTNASEILLDIKRLQLYFVKILLNQKIYTFKIF